jgi:hypothetical protein
MSEAPKRIWAWWDDDYDVGVVSKHGDKRYIPHEAREYIRREDVLATIKRALEGVVDVLEDEGWLGDSMLRIRALDPAQFIEEPKP